jgi:OmpA-OmpF porin, OOP family
MLKRAALLLSVPVPALLLASLACAETQPKPISVTPFVGGYTFDGGQRLLTKPVYGLRAGYDLDERWGVEGVFDYVATKLKGGLGDADSFSYRLEGLYNLMPGNRLMPFLAAGLGGNTISYSGGAKDSTDASLDYGAGIKYLLSDSWALRGDLRNVLVFNRTNQVWSNLEYTVGLSYLFGGAAKPAPPPPQPPSPTSNLSVTPRSVTKGEKATLSWSSENSTDCDLQPNIGPVKPQGSMDVNPSADTDYTLSCSGLGGTARSAANVSVVAPVTPAPKASLSIAPGSISPGQSGRLTWTSQNAEGCDIQPNIGPVKTEGSMDVTPSADTTYTLTCTGAGGTAESAAGISVAAPAPAPKKEQLCQTLNIEFETGKADIPGRYHDDLARLADFMKEFPQVKGVIAGHTDNRGGKAYNDRLSERRAQSVRNYLVDKFGIEGSRLGVKGYGYSKPIATNATAEGRQKNRRIVADFGCVEK